MADPGNDVVRPRMSLINHVTVMAVTILVISAGTLVRCEKKEVPAAPESSFDFEDIDTDGNGCVEGPEELQNFRLQVGKILGEALQLDSIERALRAGRITHSADVNGDGRICQCDLLSILLTETTGPGVHRHAFRVYEDGSFFDDVDSDGNGILDDVTEKEAMTQKLAQCVPLEQARRVVDAMSKLERDDGKLSRAEYMLFLKYSFRMAQPAPQPSASLPQGSQSLPQPQSLPQSQSSLPQHAPQQPVQPYHQKTQTSSENNIPMAKPDRAEGRPRKRVLPQDSQQFLRTPTRTSQAAYQPSQVWNQPHQHFQPLMNTRGQAETHPQSQQMNQPAQPQKAINQPQKVMNQPQKAANPPKASVRSMTSRGQSASAKQPVRPSQPAAQSDSGFSLSQVQQNPARLENFSPSLQQGLEPQLTKLGESNDQNQPQPQPGQRQPQPGQPQPQLGQHWIQAYRTKLEMLPPHSQARVSNLQPSHGQSKSDQPKPQLGQTDQEMENLSDQLNEVNAASKIQPANHQTQLAGKNLETQLEEKRNW